MPTRRGFLIGAGASAAGVVFGRGLFGAGTALAAGTVHPYAAAQPTSKGKTLWPLYAHEGRIYAGYGDYSANTGPMHIMSADPDTLEWTDHHILESEAIYSYRTLSDGLYVPSTDPRGAFSDDFATNASGQWESHNRVVNATHAYDIVERVPGELWIAGSQNVDAVAWKYVGGQWIEAARTPTLEYDYNRFYFAAVLSESVYLQAFPGPYNSMRWDGSTWSEGPPGLQFLSKFTPFADGLICTEGGSASAGRLGFFDGVRVVYSGFTCFDFSVQPDGVYALTSLGVILFSTDFKSWSQVGQGSTTGAGLAVIGTTAYVGTTESTIERVELGTPTSTTTTIPPTTTTTRNGRKPPKPPKPRRSLADTYLL